ncbi:O-antigen ligase family protein [Thermasporomyces composti]|jgi:O-antigen ligase|uniref:O-antigen ligase-like membrane protein n=1 Tax=Thermasporomyces composti TaxID=696763 RepID=A0A3D9V492_THECX|nr:O-antigen ligase family protein [Thermasporomyces composti]REF36558.1 O-antigen ligase-like membrane protein [Thermasporomyces composti]
MISLAFGVAAVVAALAVWRWTPTLRRWTPSFGLLVAVLTVVPPHQTVAFGIGADDALFLLGLVVLLPGAVRRGRLDRVPFGRTLVVGVGLVAAGACVSSFVNAETVPETVGMLLRGPARVLLYLVMAVVVLAQTPRDLTRYVVGRALAGVGIFESAFSLVAYVVGFPGGFGLQEASGNTALVGEIPGRVTGTLDLSPNFLGALLVLSIPVTCGIALDATSTRHRIGWLAGVVVQGIALVLTYTRSSLAVTVVACLLLLVLTRRLAGLVDVLRQRRRWALAGGAVAAVGVAALLVWTPLLDRVLHDRTDRLALYTSALRVFADYPLTGVGPGEQATFTAADPERYRATSFGVAGSNAHNTVLLAAAENGVLGLVGALLVNVGLAAVAITVIRRARERAGLARAEPLGIGVAVLAFLIQGMANNLFTVTLTASALVMLVAGCALPWLAEDPRVEEPVTELGPDPLARQM